jgi:hypothetical protein
LNAVRCLKIGWSAHTQWLSFGGGFKDVSVVLCTGMMVIDFDDGMVCPVYWSYEQMDERFVS